MKKGIHPEYGPAKVTCSCGNVFETNSTVKEMHVNSCSACHPYYTGKKTFVDTEGRIDAFKRRFAKKGSSLRTATAGRKREPLPAGLALPGAVMVRCAA